MQSRNKKLGYIRAIQKWEWKPALALIYPNHCFFTAVSFRPFLTWSTFVSTFLPIYKRSCRVQLHRGLV